MKRWFVSLYIAAAVIAVGQILNVVLRLFGLITHSLFGKIEITIIFLILLLLFISFITIVLINDRYPKKSGK